MSYIWLGEAMDRSCAMAMLKPAIAECRAESTPYWQYFFPNWQYAVINSIVILVVQFEHLSKMRVRVGRLMSANANFLISSGNDKIPCAHGEPAPYPCRSTCKRVRASCYGYCVLFRMILHFTKLVGATIEMCGMERGKVELCTPTEYKRKYYSFLL